MKEKTIRSIRRAVAGAPAVDGAGVRLVRVLGRDDVHDFDPFLLLDAFDSRNPDDYIRGFPWHPHRGIETVTYLIEGRIEHGDSLGNKGVITDGSCQWMTAGGGIIHQEMPQPAPRMLGFQLWLNLPKKDKFAPPAYRELDHEAIPKVEDESGTVGVIAGNYRGVEGATGGDYVTTLMLDVALAPNRDFTLETEADTTVFVYAIEGEGVCGVGDEPLPKQRAVLFGEGEVLRARASGEGLRFIVFAAKPLREPIAWGGPIVMNTLQELDQASAELKEGTFVRHP